MVGILLISHGKMAEGMIDSCKLLFGQELDQVDYLSLKEGDDPSSFRSQIMLKISELDSGDGVICLADILGGTPCNQLIYCLSDKVKGITGMNLPLLLEILTLRSSCIDIESLVMQTKETIVYLNRYIEDI